VKADGSVDEANIESAAPAVGPDGPGRKQDMTGAAIWSAVAASFAALSSFLIMLVQRRSLLESVRPELVLSGWGKREEGEGDHRHEVLTFNTIRNVGRGVAIQVFCASFKDQTQQPGSTLPTFQAIPLLAPNETIQIDGQVGMFWTRVKEDKQGNKSMSITIPITCWDRIGRLHETRYNLSAVQGPTIHSSELQEVTHGVLLATRRTTAEAPWCSRWRNRAGNLRKQAGRLWASIAGKKK
jgi:hypothetical protein